MRWLSRPWRRRTTQLDLHALMASGTDVVLRVADDGRTDYVSPSVTALTGWTPEDLISRQMDLIHPDDVHVLGAIRDSLLHGTIEQRAATGRFRMRNGDYLWVEWNGRLMRGELGRKPALVVFMRDVSARVELERRLEELASTDGLTGLANRRAFDDALEQAWRRCVVEQGELSLVLLDLDHFKRLNDRYGHQVGDDCLRATAAAIRSSLRGPGDLAARYGGEEFGIILPGADMAAALRVAEAARQAICELRIPHQDNLAGGNLLSASLGTATALSRAGGTIKMPEGLLQSADAAMYRAKRDGRNRVVSTMLLMAQSGSH